MEYALFIIIQEMQKSIINTAFDIIKLARLNWGKFTAGKKVGKMCS